jgi:hypothetical protein
MFRLVLEASAIGELRLLQVLDAVEMAIVEGRVGERPKMLGGLWFRGVRRQEEQVEMVGHAEALGGMPAGPLEDQDDLLGRACARIARKGGELGLKEGYADARREMKERPTRRWVHTVHKVTLGVAVLERRHGALPNRRPDVRWLEPER